MEIIGGREGRYSVSGIANEEDFMVDPCFEGFVDQEGPAFYVVSEAGLLLVMRL